MHESKYENTSLGHHTKFLITEACNSIKEGRAMKTVLYANGVGSIMYGLCVQTEAADVARVVSRFIVDLGRAHWEALKWLLRYLNETILFEWRIGGLSSEI